MTPSTRHSRHKCCECCVGHSTWLVLACWVDVRVMSACARIPLWSRHMRNSPVATRAAMFHDLCGQIHTKPGKLVESQHSFEGLAQFRRACVCRASNQLPVSAP